MQHRFTAAESLLGVVGMIIGLWLIWPSVGPQTVDHRKLWERSLSISRAASVLEADDAVEAGPSAPAALASVAISAKGTSLSSLGVHGTVGATQAQTFAYVEPATASEPEVVSSEALDALAAKVAEVERQVSRELQSAPDAAPAREEAVETAALPPPPAEQQAAAPEDPGVEAPAAPPMEQQTAALMAPRVAPPSAPRSGVPAWLRNAAVAPSDDGRPMIAIVLDDLGLNRRNTAALNGLPGPLTLAFLPYAGDLPRQTRAARAAGHELMLHMPMEPEGKESPGPDALLSSLDPDEFERRLLKNFDAFSGFVGLNNHMGSRLTARRSPMARVIGELRRRDLLFLDSKTTARSVGGLEARRQGVPYAQRDVFLDNQIELGHVMRQLRATEELARRRGSAVAIGHPHDVTIEALRRWLPQLEGRGFRLVPITTIVATQNCVQPPMMVVACTQPGGAVSTLAARVDGQPG